MRIMNGARTVAAAAALGNFLQGWDSSTLAGCLLYIKPEFNLEHKPILEGAIVAITLVGATISSSFSGPGADWLGRRSMLCISSLLFCVGAVIMAWSPDIYVLLVGRFIDGFGIGIALSIAPLYISEVAPADIRGELNTLPQLAGSGGMFLAYCMVFGVSLTSNPSWRLMLGIILILSLIYLALCIFYMPESPRWLVSKGRMLEAKQVMQRLRNREDVAGEMALLVEGLGVSGETTLEEYIIQPIQSVEEESATGVAENGGIKLFGSEEGVSWIARPLSSMTGSQGFLSRRASMEPQSAPRLASVSLMDPMVTVIGSLRGSAYNNLPELGSLRNIIQDHHYEPMDDGKNEQWDEESIRGAHEAGDYHSDDEMVGQLDENLTSPLLSRHTSIQREQPPLDRADSIPFSTGNSISGATSMSRANSRDVKDLLPTLSHSSVPPNTLPHDGVAESFGSMGIGGGWQLAWRWTGPEGTEGKPEEGSFKRIFLLQEGGGEQSRLGSTLSLPRLGSTVGGLEPIQAAALVSRPSQYGKDILPENPVGPAMLHPSETATHGPAWSELLEGGVKRALIVGVVLQILEQFAGINAVLYFTPQILQESGAEVLLSKAGISSDSASLLASAVTTLLSLPCIIVAMRLMDQLGRRQILLSTIPILVISLLALITINIVPRSPVAFATISILSVVVYVCFFVMGFGPIPNILCAEIFPTRVRGVCIAICQAALWISDILVTELFPVLDQSIGIAGAFAIFAVVCSVSWVFVFLKVPETKGMPLEVIVEFFAMSAAESQKPYVEVLEKDQDQEP